MIVNSGKWERSADNSINFTVYTNLIHNDGVRGDLLLVVDGFRC